MFKVEVPENGAQKEIKNPQNGFVRTFNLAEFSIHHQVINQKARFNF